MTELTEKLKSISSPTDSDWVKQAKWRQRNRWWFRPLQMFLFKNGFYLKKRFK